MSTTLSHLLLLLRAFRSSFFKNLTRRGRYSCTTIWRLITRFAGYFFNSLQLRLEDPPYPSIILPEQAENDPKVFSAGDTSVICASLLPVPSFQSRSRESSLLSSSRTSLISNTSEISFNIVPPEADDRASHHSSVSFDRRSGNSMILTTDNPMSSQIFELAPGANNSQRSIVRPASPSLAQGIPDPHIYPLMPHKVPRYKRERWIAEHFIECSIEATRNHYSLGELPDGWKQLTHPEGQPYFYHQSKRIATDCWIWDEKLFNLLDGFLRKIEAHTESKHLDQPLDTLLVLEITVEEEDLNWCGYYYACSTTKSVFWLDEMDISPHAGEARGDLSPTHIQLYLEHQYWYHWDLFPHINEGTSDIYDLVLNTLADARTDIQTSTSSTVNYTKDDLIEMTSIVAGMKARPSPTSSNWCLGRFMQLLVKDRFLNYHGQYGARLNFAQSVHAEKKDPQRTLLIRMFSPLLLSAPNTHLKSLQSLWVDKMTIKARWVKYFMKMNEQWGEHIVHASILLNANVAFLAIPSNDPSNNSSVLLPRRTIAQIASYISVVTSFGSMMLALMLVRQHKAKESATQSVGQYHQFLNAHYHSKYGFERLAIVYSLPYALLTWAMVSFFVAFVLMCFVISTTVVRSILGVTSGLLCVLILWCILTFWEESGLKMREHLKKLHPYLEKFGRPVHTTWMRILRREVKEPMVSKDDLMEEKPKEADVQAMDATSRQHAGLAPNSRGAHSWPYSWLRRNHTSFGGSKPVLPMDMPIDSPPSTV